MLKKKIIEKIEKKKDNDMAIEVVLVLDFKLELPSRFSLY